jgi:hypothetical protein
VTNPPRWIALDRLVLDGRVLAADLARERAGQR